MNTELEIQNAANQFAHRNPAPGVRNLRVAIRFAGHSSQFKPIQTLEFIFLFHLGDFEFGVGLRRNGGHRLRETMKAKAPMNEPVIQCG